MGESVVVGARASVLNSQCVNSHLVHRFQIHLWTLRLPSPCLNILYAQKLIDLTCVAVTSQSGTMALSVSRDADADVGISVGLRLGEGVQASPASTYMGLLVCAHTYPTQPSYY